MESAVPISSELHDIVKERVMIGHGVAFEILCVLRFTSLSQYKGTPPLCFIKFVSQSAVLLLNN